MSRAIGGHFYHEFTCLLSSGPVGLCLRPQPILGVPSLVHKGAVTLLGPTVTHYTSEALCMWSQYHSYDSLAGFYYICIFLLFDACTYARHKC